MTKGEAVLKIIELVEASTQENLRQIKSFIADIDETPAEEIKE